LQPLIVERRIVKPEACLWERQRPALDRPHDDDDGTITKDAQRHVAFRLVSGKSTDILLLGAYKKFSYLLAYVLVSIYQNPQRLSLLMQQSSIYSM